MIKTIPESTSPWVDDIWSQEPDLGRLEAARRMFTGDPQAAYEELERLAKTGSVKSMVFLGNAYRLGKHISINLNKAEEWYLQAASRGYVPAIYYLGLMYSKRKQYSRAIDEFEKCAAQNYPVAVYMLGQMYLKGTGTRIDFDRARMYWEHCNALGLVRAKTALGNLLLSGRFGFFQGLRGVFLKCDAILAGYLIRRKNPADPRLN